MGKSHLNVDDQEPVATSSKKAKEPDSQSESEDGPLDPQQPVHHLCICQIKVTVQIIIIMRE